MGIGVAYDGCVSSFRPYARGTGSRYLLSFLRKAEGDFARLIFSLAAPEPAAGKFSGIMGKTMQSKFIALLAAATIFAAIGGAAAAPREITDPVNVRSGPGPKWPVIGVIEADTEMNVQNCGQGWKRAWCQVQFGDKIGFVHASALAPLGNTVIVAPLVTTNLANVRSGPGKKWPVVATIEPSTQVNISSCSKGWGTSWCLVHIDGTTGYINRLLLARQNALFPQ